MKTRNLALLGALVPLAALVGGCGGGGSNGPSNTPIPAPTFIGPSTGTPNFPTITVPQSLLRLPSGQFATLNLTRTGGSIGGTLRVLNGTASASPLPPNLYQVSGAFSAPTAFSVSPQTSGTGAAIDKFTLTGNLPRDSNSNGSYKFTQNNLNGTGVLLAPNTSVVRPQFGMYAVQTSDLQFSNFTPAGTTGFDAPRDVVSNPFATNTGGGGFDGQGVNPANVGAYTYRIRGDQFFPSLRVVAVREVNGAAFQPLTVEVQLNSVAANQTAFAAGQTFSLTPGATNGGISANVRISYDGRSYTSTSGTLTIRSLSSTDTLNNITLSNPAEDITLGLNNVGLVFSGAGNAQSSFKANGDLSISGLSTVYDVQ